MSSLNEILRQYNADEPLASIAAEKLCKAAERAFDLFFFDKATGKGMLQDECLKIPASAGGKLKEIRDGGGVVLAVSFFKIGV